MKTEKYDVTGMTCAACQANVTRCVQKLDGVQDVDVNLLSNQMTVSYNEQVLSAPKIIEAVQKIGYGASLPSPTESKQNSFRHEWQKRQKRTETEQRQMKHRLISSLIFLVVLMYVAMGHMIAAPMPFFFVGEENAMISALAQLLLTIPVLFINRHFFQNGFRALIHRAPNMDSLVAMGSGASFLYGVFAMFMMAYGLGSHRADLVHEYAHALYFESAAMILTLVTVGKFLEAKSKAKTSDALGKLVDLTPKSATVVRNGVEMKIPAEQIVESDIVVVRPGEGIPVDGVIVEGNGYVDQSAITGESIPVEKSVGDAVISASVNKNGTFRFQASRVGENTTLAQIIRLVDEAGQSKAPIARLADKVSGIFVPVVFGIAVLTAVIWLIAGKSFDFALSNAISVLVISCPCALGLATPVSIMVGTGKAAEMGILIKSAQTLEQLHAVDTIVLDKTGTITSGHPKVTDVLLFSEDLSESEFLAQAAAAESGSEHPLAQAIVEKAQQEKLNIPQAESFLAYVGSGIRATVCGHTYLAGNLSLMEQHGYLGETRSNTENILASVDQLSAQGKTPLLFARDEIIVGIIAVADTVRDSSREAIRRFLKMGLQVLMLTGDNQRTAEAIRSELEISNVISDVLPTQKEFHIRQLQQQGHRVVMVGDGINDAPALMRADVGIAIGAGTDIAIDSADVVLMKDSLLDVVNAIDLSRAVMRNIRMNLFWAFFYNVLGIPVAAGALFPAFGIRLSPMIGSAAMSLSSVCVVLNALRLKLFRPTFSAKQPEEERIAKQASVLNNIDIHSNQKGKISMKKVMKVDGMMCDHCKMHVQKALEAVDGVQSVVVDLDKKQATIELSEEVSDQVLSNAVKEAGYTPVSCQQL